ncbi:MAG: hypothetical protein EKK42_09210 [Pseudonocardiaceae bacterium]|nr:MAG: hypothetical protein EKK42_09210 [Pseudonocardiaceae bacterium]
MSRPLDTDATTTTTEGTMHDHLDDQRLDDQRLDDRHLDDRHLDNRHEDVTDSRVAEAGGPGGWGGQAGSAPVDTHATDIHADPHAADPHAADTRPADTGVTHTPPGESRAARMSEPSAVSEQAADETALIPRQRAADYQDRWQTLKAQFVDEPRTAVRDANELVGQVLDEIEETFRTQRADLERDLHDDAASTEDLRLALGRYRTFFDRLLSF